MQVAEPGKNASGQLSELVDSEVEGLQVAEPNKQICPNFCRQLIQPIAIQDKLLQVAKPGKDTIGQLTELVPSEVKGLQVAELGKDTGGQLSELISFQVEHLQQRVSIKHVFRQVTQLVFAYIENS